jgi:UDP-N-acetylmuramyl pentapeptide phosphotransferase/UDP-N-acetylglucosamine-1-phosphate transferase
MAEAEGNHPANVFEGDFGAAFIGGEGLSGTVSNNVTPQAIHIQLGANLGNFDPIVMLKVTEGSSFGP